MVSNWELIEFDIKGILSFLKESILIICLQVYSAQTSFCDSHSDFNILGFWIKMQSHRSLIFSSPRNDIVPRPFDKNSKECFKIISLLFIFPGKNKNFSTLAHCSWISLHLFANILYKIKQNLFISLSYFTTPCLSKKQQ